MPATDDYYTCASGGSISAGIAAADTSLPAWVPAPGYLQSVHLNDLAALNPCPSNTCWYSETNKQNAPWSLWSGAVFAPGYSEYGAMIYWGGGHSGYDGIEHYLFDLSTQSWSIPDAATTPDSDFLPDLDPTWCDLEHQGQHIIPTTHAYSHGVYLPPGFGGGAKGAWCMPFNVFGPEYGITGNAQPHALDLATGLIDRLTANTLDLNVSGNGPYGGAFVDTARNKVWLMPGNGSNENAYIDLTATPLTLVKDTSFYTPGYYFVPCYVEAADMLICVNCSYEQTLIAITGYDMASGTPVAFTVPLASANNSVKGPGLGIDWCPDTKKFYLYEGYGSADVITLTPPADTADWKTVDWAWGSDTMLGETPVDVNEVAIADSSAQVLSKWKYNSKLKCFMWSQGTASRTSPDAVDRAGAFQLWRPAGT